MNEATCALVTGASRGIGKAIARGLAEAGYTVVGTATGEAGLNAIRADLCDDFPTARALELQLTNDASIEALMDELTAAKLLPGILVNNAGITRDNLLLRMKDDEWDDVINTNLTAMFKLTKRLVRPMIKARSGRIINIGSVVGSSGNPGQANYAAAKAGMIGFTKSLAREIANRGVTVNAVAPGFIDTDMTRDLAEEHKKQMLAQVPVGRLGRPEEIAAAVVFLASPAAGYITGETLHVNGGMLMP